jgi:flagellar hook-associated protein 3 FlgL
MRVSTSTMYDLGISAIQQRTSELVKTQQDLSSGRRILSPQDDPTGAARALDLGQSLTVTQQYQTNIATATSQLNLEESVLSGVTQVIQDAKVTAVNAGNATLSSANLQALAADLRSHYQQLLGLANSKDGQGQYMFSGFQGSQQPFTQTSGAGTYAGDQGQRTIQIGPSRQLPISDPGQDVFNPGIAGKDVFQTLDTLINQLGSGSITSAQVSTALSGLDSALNNILRVRSSVGARLNELDGTGNTHDQTVLQYQTAISGIQDLDYTQAITDLTRQQTSLQAAQKSFVSVQNLSLFSFLT